MPSKNIEPPIRLHSGLLKSEGDWTEDFPHENGNYTNICASCKKEFVGHKRRFICKICAKAEVVLIGEDGIGKTHAMNSLTNCIDGLIHQTTKEAKQLHEIIEMDKAIKITASHFPEFKKGKANKKPVWKKGKLKKYK